MTGEWGSSGWTGIFRKVPLILLVNGSKWSHKSLRCRARQLGDRGFRETYGVEYCYYAGAMAMGIASEEMVIALGRAGFMGSFGAAGLLPPRVKTAVETIRKALPHGPYAFNLIYSPGDPLLEKECVDLYLSSRRALCRGCRLSGSLGAVGPLQGCRVES